MPSGVIKKTKVSKGSGEIPMRLWKFILREQLMVDEEVFNKKNLILILIEA